MKISTAIAYFAVMTIDSNGASLSVRANGEDACENRGFNRAKCAEVGCCEWDDGQCWSSVGSRACSSGNGASSGGDGASSDGDEASSDGDEASSDGDGASSGGDGASSGGGVLLPGVVGWREGKVLWTDPPSGWDACGKVTTVFGVAVCVTSAAWSSSQSKCDHIAHVFYQLLDNDADNVPDDSAVLSEMVNNGYLLYVPNTEQDSQNTNGRWPDQVGKSQMTGIFEATLNSCDVPTNRGLSATDRTTWPSAIETENLNCINDSDATVEEILHLITEAAVVVYPTKWASTASSDAGVAILAANGNCGWGYSKDYIDPSSNNCIGQYAYDDETCKLDCVVVEGIYWASVSYIGGLYTKRRTEDIRNEWLMATPDASMEILPSGVSNAVSLEEGSPALYDLVSDTTSEGHKWLPAIMPDGRYEGGGNIPTPTLAPPERPATLRPSDEDEDFDGDLGGNDSDEDEDFDGDLGGNDSDEDEDFDGDLDGNDSDAAGGDEDTCFDRVLAFRGNPNKDCDWVAAKPNRRCGKEWNEKPLWEYCPVACMMECFDCCDISLYECEESGNADDECMTMYRRCEDGCMAE